MTIRSLPTVKSQESKACTSCSQTYPLEFFSRVTKTTRKCFADGRIKVCRSCMRLIRATSQEKHGKVGMIAAAKERNKIEKHLIDNPDQAWCAKGKHFVEASQMAQSTTRASGHNSKCRECTSEHYIANADSIRAKSREWYFMNWDRARTARKAYYDALPNEKKQEYRRRSYQNNRAQKAAYKRFYAAKNREKLAEAARQYYLREKERYRADRQTIRATKYNAAGSFTKDQWLAKCEFYGYRCYLCGASFADVTINVEHRVPFSRGGTNWLANVAPACQTCNLSKGQMTEKEYRASLPP